MLDQLRTALKRIPFLYVTAVKTIQFLRRANPVAVAKRVQQQKKRDVVDRMLAELGKGHPSIFDEGDILVDGMWDNPNYWLRFSLLRNALGLSQRREVGLLGEFAKSHCARTFKTLGIKTVRTFSDFMPSAPHVLTHARELIENTQSATDILEWNLPGNVPGLIVYDAILKVQRLPSVDIHAPSFEEQVIEALRCIEAGQRILDAYDFKLLILTHPFNYTWGALAWQAMSREIPVILAFGFCGTLRFTHMKQPMDLFSFYDRPSLQDIDDLTPERAKAMGECGRAYLQNRLAGKTDDLPAIFAYQRNTDHIDRQTICEQYNWDPEKPIVAFYASNWFDWPHQLGMTRFTDFLDWVMSSFEAMKENTDVNWLLKPHPCEEWFGGVALAETIPPLDDLGHINLTNKSWNNVDVLNSIDALITYHGTAGIEFAAMGKPVLIPDVGKYENCGFVKFGTSRDDYLALLKQKWWDGIDLELVKKRAEIFCGWWFCAPQWQGGFILADDAKQWALYDQIPVLLESNKHVISHETDVLRDWFQSGFPYSHIYKMKLSENFILANV
ncbi:MAG: hypothetical protein NUV50_09610 [Rhodospirillales bacterium]|nr:hypothetical protein [Rhodospirillales bacterium]